MEIATDMYKRQRYGRPVYVRNAVADIEQDKDQRPFGAGFSSSNHCPDPVRAQMGGCLGAAGLKRRVS